MTTPPTAPPFLSKALLYKVAPLLLREITVAASAAPGAQAQSTARGAVGLCLPLLLEVRFPNDVMRTMAKNMKIYSAVVL